MSKARGSATQPNNIFRKNEAVFEILTHKFYWGQSFSQRVFMLKNGLGSNRPSRVVKKLQYFKKFFQYFDAKRWKSTTF